MIKLQNVNKYFNRHKKNEIHVINNVSLELESTGLVAILGPSGSGKTTLLNAIGGLDKVNKGKIFINEEEITTFSTHKRDKIRNINIGYIFQDYKLVDDLSVFENIALVLKMIGIKDKKEINTRVEYVLNAVNMYRYRNRPAGMLSGGERQRVGIARAIVKDPEIIIADEPTGNLDSKNSLEIMNIIKAISKKKTVILVTHEQELAKFYASRIIEIKDGVIQKDYENKEVDELDYSQENTIYLKDLKEQETIDSQYLDINYYAEKKEKIKLDIVVKNGNIYIKPEKNAKVEIVDEQSSIELVNKNYQKIDKSVYQEYKFDFDKAINKNIKKKYSSILNPFTLTMQGFKKVFNFSILKKILLGGFFLASMFIVYSFCSIMGTLNIEDKDFVTTNRNYLAITMNNLTVDQFLEYEIYPEVDYLLPGDSKISFTAKYDDFYQTSTVQDTLSGSLASIDLIKQEDLIYGRMPQNEYEIVVDKMALDTMFESSNAQMSGILTIEDMLNRKVSVTNMDEFQIVGITDQQSPSIYTYENMFINLLSNGKANSGNNTYSGAMVLNSTNAEEPTGTQLLDYSLLENKIELKEGRYPTNDYEVMVNINNKEQMPLEQEIETKVNDKKLKVVGYYFSQENSNYYLVNNNTIKYNLIVNSFNLTVNPTDKQAALNKFQQMNMNIQDSYEKAKEEYVKDRQENVVSSLVVTGIILAISLIEIYLMVRSSFLSRIKEIGIYRAIGVKKTDIYKMFLGEIIAITTLASMPGVIFMAYILKVLTGIEYIASYFLINLPILLAIIVFVYAFNILVGLLPVFHVVRKTPSQILSRHDLD